MQIPGWRMLLPTASKLHTLFQRLWLRHQPTSDRRQPKQRAVSMWPPAPVMWCQGTVLPPCQNILYLRSIDTPTTLQRPRPRPKKRKKDLLRRGLPHRNMPWALPGRKIRHPQRHSQRRVPMKRRWLRQRLTPAWLQSRRRLPLPRMPTGRLRLRRWSTAPLPNQRCLFPRPAIRFPQSRHPQRPMI